MGQDGGVFIRKKVLIVDKRSKSVRSKDPMVEFKKSSRREFGKYDLPGEVWRSLRKLLAAAAFLAFGYFAYECWRAWDIFQ